MCKIKKNHKNVPSHHTPPGVHIIPKLDRSKRALAGGPRSPFSAFAPFLSRSFPFSFSFSLRSLTGVTMFEAPMVAIAHIASAPNGVGMGMADDHRRGVVEYQPIRWGRRWAGLDQRALIEEPQEIRIGERMRVRNAFGSRQCSPALPALLPLAALPFLALGSRGL